MEPQEHQAGVTPPSGFWWVPQSWSHLLASSSLFPACLVACLSFYVEWGIERGALHSQASTLPSEPHPPKLNFFEMKWAENAVQLVEHLPSVHETLSLVPTETMHRMLRRLRQEDHP